MTAPLRLAAVCAPALLAATAIGHATGGERSGGSPAVVTVGAGAHVATGFVAAPGRVVTVAHAVPGTTTTVHGAGGRVLRATVVRRDDDLDLAVLSVPGLRGSGTFALGRGGVLVRRDGGVRSLHATILRHASARVLSGSGRLVARRPVLEVRAGIRAGDSGAPVLDAGGRVAGVVFAQSRERAGVAYAVDASVLASLLRQP